MRTIRTIYERQNAMTPIVHQMSPLRDYKTVAAMMGLNWQDVWRIERNAMWKIHQRMREAVLAKGTR